jgi:hypothetical protein
MGQVNYISTTSAEARCTDKEIGPLVFPTSHEEVLNYQPRFANRLIADDEWDHGHGPRTT